MYELLSRFAQTWGLIFFLIGFAAVLVYALWPRNQKKFDKAAEVPLKDDDKPDAARVMVRVCIAIGASDGDFDDNVHVQNTVVMADALIAATRPLDASGADELIEEAPIPGLTEEKADD